MEQKMKSSYIVSASIIITALVFVVLHLIKNYMFHGLSQESAYAFIVFLVFIPSFALLISTLLGAHIHYYTFLYTIVIYLCAQLVNKGNGYPLENIYITIFTVVPSLIGMFYGRYLKKRGPLEEE